MATFVTNLLAMLLLGIFQTVEFYVIVSVIAAAVVAYMAIPAERGEAKLHMLAGELYGGDAAAVPSIEFHCMDDGSVMLVRKGLHGVSASGAASIAVKVIGFDLMIEERLTPGSMLDMEMTEAQFRLDFLAPEWYHIKYNSETVGRFCAASLHVRPGLVLRKELIQ
jgi:hypothetical protein